MPQNDSSYSLSISNLMGYFYFFASPVYIFKISCNRCTSFHNQSKISYTSNNICTVLSLGVSYMCIDYQALSVGTFIGVDCVIIRVSVSGRK